MDAGFDTRSGFCSFEIDVFRHFRAQNREEHSLRNRIISPADARRLS
jgi:hypothetical protein